MTFLRPQRPFICDRHTTTQHCLQSRLKTSAGVLNLLPSEPNVFPRGEKLLRAIS